MKLPSPGEEAFNKIGPEARKLARLRNEAEGIK